MTEDYKKSLLEYITNTVNQTEATTDEIIKEIIELDITKWEPFLPVSPYRFRFEGLIPANELTSGFTILYGGYTTEAVTTTNGKGIILLLGQDFYPVKSFYQYESGTELRYIQQMKQAEDGTFYMIDDTQYSFNTLSGTPSQKRFVMVNNFTIPNSENNYVLQLRKSYIMQSPYNTFYCHYLEKNPNSSHYIMAGATNDGQATIEVIDLKINVGSANQWTLYKLSSTQTRTYIYCTAIASFDSNDNARFRLLYTYTSGSNSVLLQMYKNYLSNSYSTATIVTLDIPGFGYSLYYGQQFEFLTYNNCYFVANDHASLGTTGFLRLYKYDFSTEELQEIYNNQGTNETMNIFALNGELYIQYNNNINDVSKTADYYIQRLMNDVWNPILVAQNKKYVVGNRALFVRQTFNITQIFLYSENITQFLCLIKENYNLLNYNGEPYTDYNSLIAKQGTIYSNNSLVFARNLYNQTIYDNVSNSTVVVPNTYLNDMTLTQNNLLSETNVTMVTQNQPYTKNIYETLYLNFLNTTTVIDEDTNTNYPTAASYITTNSNTGTETNCQNTSVGTIKINKSTPIYQNIYWDAIDDTHKQTTITLYIDELIPSIDFVSNDKSTVYLTIDTSDLEVGNIYTITQSLRVE